MSLARLLTQIPRRAPKVIEPEFPELPLYSLPTKEQILAALKDERDLTNLFPHNGTLLATLTNVEDVTVHTKLIRGIIAFPALFEKLIKSPTDIKYIAEKCNESARIIINYVVREETQFKRLLTSKIYLPGLATLFPCHADVFGQNDIRQAASISKIKTYMYHLLLIKIHADEKYKLIPKPVLLQIAAHAAVSDTEKVDYQHAMQTFKITH